MIIKLRIALLLALSCIIIFPALLAGCRSEATDGENTSDTRVQITLPDFPIDNGDGILDLAAMPTSRAYATLNDVFASYREYQGQKMRVSGTFEAYHDEQKDRYYYTCVILDENACCSLVIEFVLSADTCYPDDYPENGTTVTVSGTFNTYEENGFLFSQLINATIE